MTLRCVRVALARCGVVPRLEVPTCLARLGTIGPWRPVSWRNFAQPYRGSVATATPYAFRTCRRYPRWAHSHTCGRVDRSPTSAPCPAASWRSGPRALGRGPVGGGEIAGSFSVALRGVSVVESVGVDFLLVVREDPRLDALDRPLVLVGLPVVIG